MKTLKFILPLFFFIVFSMVSIFLTGAVLYVCGEFFSFFIKEYQCFFHRTLFLGKIGIYIGSFTGLMLWIANLLKK